MLLCVDMFSNWPEAWSCKKAVQSPPSDQVCHDIQPRDWVCIRELCRKNALKPRWSKPQHVLRTTITTVKCEGHHTWIHATHCKDPPPLKDNAGTGEADQQLLQSEEQRSDTGTRVPEEADQHSLLRMNKGAVQAPETQKQMNNTFQTTNNHGEKVCLDYSQENFRVDSTKQTQGITDPRNRTCQCTRMERYHSPQQTHLLCRFPTEISG